MQKLFPLILFAISLAFVPQYLGEFGSVSDETSQPAQKVVAQKKTAPAHYTTGKREVRIKAGRNGHFASTFKANGRKIEGLIDTGATYVAINQSTARSLGIRLSKSDFKHKANTANGVTKAAFAKIKQMEIGSIRVKNVDAFILDDKSLSSTLIGMSFISKLSSFRVENSELILTQ